MRGRDIFDGAADSSQSLGWSFLPELNPDEELEYANSLIKLRKRSHDLIKNNLTVAGIQQRFINIICGEGVKIRVTSKSKRQKKNIEKLFKPLFKYIDLSGTTSFETIIDQIVAWSFASGDILISLPVDEGRKGLQTVIELIDAHRVQTPREYESSGSVRQGVKYDGKGRVVGYYVLDSDKPNMYNGGKEAFTYMPRYKLLNGKARLVTDLFKAPWNTRPNMSRMYPLVTPLMTLLKNFDSYMEAVIVGARVAACFSAFVKTSSPKGTKDSFEGAGAGTADNRNPDQRVTKLQPGQIVYMRPQEEVQFAAPNRPGDNADAYMLRNYRMIAAYFQVPYEILFLDLNKVSWSAWRGGSLETRKMIRRWRRELRNKIDWIVGTYYIEGIEKGLIRGELGRIETQVKFVSDGLLDPEKQARADKIDIVDLKSKQNILSDRGEEYEDMKAEREQEAYDALELQTAILIKRKELSEEHGIVFPETVTDNVKEDRKTNRRVGEDETKSDLDEEDAEERRKEDGNW